MLSNLEWKLSPLHDLPKAMFTAGCRKILQIFLKFKLAGILNILVLSYSIFIFYKDIKVNILDFYNIAAI